MKSTTSKSAPATSAKTSKPAASTKKSTSAASSSKDNTREAAIKETAIKEAKVTIISEEPKTAAPKASQVFDHSDVATKAYLLWEEEGYQHGKDREYWLKAESLLKSGKY